MKKHLHHLAEVGLTALPAALVNVHFFPDAPLYRGYALNPYLLLPVMLSLRYGTIGGFFDYLLTLAFALGACAWLGELDYVLREGWVFLLAVMFLTQLAGQLADRMRNQLEFLHQEHENLQTEFANLIQHNLALADANRELTKRIVSRFDSLNLVYESAKKLETLDLRELVPATLEILRGQVLVRAGSIYCREGGEFLLRGETGSRPGGSSRPAKLERQGMVAEALEQRETVSCLAFLEGTSTQVPDPQSGKYLVVNPVLVEGEVVAFFLVEDMDFTRSTLRMLSILADWFGTALKKIEDFREANDQRPDDPLLHGFRARYMMNQLQLEVNRAVRYSLPLSVAALRIRDHQRMCGDVLNNISSVVGFVLKNFKREIDLYGATEEPGAFLLILPATDRAGMGSFLQRVLREIVSFGFHPFDDERTLELEIRQVSLHDLIDGEVLEQLPRAEVGSRTQTILADMGRILGLEMACSGS